MPSNKNRLHVALYLRGGQVKMPGGEDRHHWALIVGPKKERTDESEDGVPIVDGIRFHAKNVPSSSGSVEWVFNEERVSTLATRQILVRVTVAKVTDQNRLLQIIRTAPVDNTNREWNCVAWVQHVLQSLDSDDKALGTRCMDWPTVRDKALQYCQDKKDAGRFNAEGPQNRRVVPTYSLLEQKETIP